MKIEEALRALEDVRGKLTEARNAILELHANTDHEALDAVLSRAVSSICRAMACVRSACSIVRTAQDIGLEEV